MAYKVLHQWALPEILIQPSSGLKGGPAGLLLESEGKAATWGIGPAVEVCELIIVHLCSFSLFLATPSQFPQRVFHDKSKSLNEQPRNLRKSSFHFTLFLPHQRTFNLSGSLLVLHWASSGEQSCVLSETIFLSEIIIIFSITNISFVSLFL